MDMIEERWTLARARVEEISGEDFGDFQEYILRVCKLFHTIEEVYDADLSMYRKWNHLLYADIEGEAYETSFANPAYCAAQFGAEMGQYLCWYYVKFREAVTAACEKEQYEIVKRMELFLQLSQILLTEEEKARFLKENLYYFIHDYEEERMERAVRRMLLPEESGFFMDIIMKSDFSDTDYLYRYGEFISENEIKMAHYLASLPEEQLRQMAQIYTEGYRKGFEIAGIDLSKKKTVQIRYHLGFEPMMRQAVRLFREMGLEPVFRREIGIQSTSPNKQCAYDHRFDDALYLNRAIVKQRLELTETLYEKYREEALAYAGPAVLEVFGEKLFVPEVKKESPSYTKEQEQLSIEYRREAALIQNRFIPQDMCSYTIIAYPIPEIGEQFEEIFRETVRVNTLDSDVYRDIQQKLIEALDEGEYVHVTGRGNNHTDIKIQLHTLMDKSRQTNFENCLADVNIPVGEVFTSPVLAGTNGVLHVTQVYLNELRYENLEFVFRDGMVTDYSCTNYETEEENRRYIKENILHNRDTLPIGEFAIGTNTTAYVMGRKFGIEAKLPILIAEKTGPHFALGDTCYSMSEDVVLHNPDGREIIAKENECSALRNEDASKAYFNCHTDITILYDELGDIVVHTADDNKIILIQEGRFVLPGTEELNRVLECEV